jgi:hypothetical protein
MRSPTPIPYILGSYLSQDEWQTISITGPKWKCQRRFHMIVGDRTDVSTIDHPGQPGLRHTEVLLRQ